MTTTSQNGEGIPQNLSEKLSSKDLALLIVDALVDAKLIEKANLEIGVKLVAEEIEVRKNLGDY